MDIAFLGLGSMGLPMARNLIKAGHTVTVWNRDRGKSDLLAREGARTAGRPADAVGAGGMAVTMVSDDAALESIALGRDGFVPALADGLHLSMSTVSAGLNRRLAAAQGALGGALVAAPVFGRPDAAAAARLSIVCSGPDAARARVRGVLDAMGPKVLDMGEDPGAANLVKLGGNYLILAATQAIAESLAMLRASGVDPRAAMGCYTATVFDCPVYRGYGARLADGDDGPGGFKLDLAAKDLALFFGEARGLRLPLADLLEGAFARAKERGLGGRDVTALARLLAPDVPSPS